MAVIVGGLRSRLIIDSLQAVIHDGLEALGWLNPNRTHEPLQILTRAREWQDPVMVNSLITSARVVGTEHIEAGSNLIRDAITMEISFYAQNDSIGVEVTNDVRDLLRGRFPFGAIRGQFPIYDYRQATPAPIGYATVAETRAARTVGQYAEAWARRVFGVEVTLNDTYYGGGSP